MVGEGSGSINTAGLTIFASLSNSSSAAVYPNEARIEIPGGSGLVWTGLTGPTSFGTRGGTAVNGFTGAIFYVSGSQGWLGLPFGYRSGDVFSNSVTYNNRTFAELGMTPGTYVWTWGSGATADSLTVQIGPAPAAVPEPLSAALLATGLIGLAAARRRREATSPA